MTQIRVWTLGSLDHKIMPADGTVEKFEKYLKTKDLPPGVDIIWGPELNLETYESEDKCQN